MIWRKWTGCVGRITRALDGDDMKCKRIAVRRTWSFKPVTRVKQSKKIYSRKRKSLPADDYALARAADQQRAYFLDHPDR